MSAINKRNVAKNSIIRYLNASTDESITFDKERISTYQELLNAQWENYNEFQQKVEETCGPETISLEENERAQTEIYYIEAASTFKRMLAEINEVELQPEAPAVSNAIAPKLKLPAFDLPRFSGDPTTWMTFFDSFNTIVHTNDALTGSQKLHYLRCALTDEPLQLIANFKLQDSNYTEAWDLLKSRYNVKRIIKDHLLAAIFAVPKADADTASAIKKVLDPIMQHVRALKQFSVSVQFWDDWLIHVIVHRMAYETRRQWELSLTDDGNPKLSDLQGFLEARCRSLEVLQSTKDVKITKSNSSFKLRKPAAVHTANVDSNKQNSKIDNYNQNLHVDNNRKTYIANPQTHISNQNVNNLQNTNANNAIRFHCPVCSGNHKIYNCDKFNSLSHILRLENILHMGACVNCLQFHAIDKCKSMSVCKMCQQKHHTMLHNAFAVSTSTASTSNASSSTASTSLASIATQAYQQAVSKASSRTGQGKGCEKTVLLATALVAVHDINGRRLTLRALLDPGSQSSFVSESCVQKLRLPRRRNNFAITGIGCTNGSTNGEITLALQSPFNNFNVVITAAILPKITNVLPTAQIQPGRWSHLKGLQLADPEYATPAKIDILIGADEISSILQPGLIIGPVGTPTAQETRLGWVLLGKVECNQTLTSLACLQVDNQLSQIISKAWELESYADKFLTPEEEACEKLFDDTHQRDIDGRFIVSLPFKPNSQLGDSRRMAIKFWLSTERRLRKNEQHRTQYHAFLQEMLDQGHLEPVNTIPAQHFYMPHHSVVKDTSSTTKTRVVFNASFKTTNGKSLNDALMIGPTLQNELVTVLLRFQMHRFALLADVAAMYRQIKVREPHTDFQRIVWRQSEDLPIQDYRILRVTYGVASSSHHAVRSLQQTAKQHETEYPLAASAIVSDFYMDDLLTGAATEQQLTTLRKNITYILSTGCFELRKFASNSPQTLRDIPSEHREQNLTHLIAEGDDIRALGLHWNSCHDYLHFEVNLPSPPTNFTKRTLLSDSCRLFDPTGKLSPVTLVPKIMFQQVWKLQLDWDDDVPSDISTQWLQHRQELQMLSRLKISRWLGTGIEGAITDLHCFADASELAYAAVIYARTQFLNGSVNVHMVCSKSRVSPLRTISISRLELCATALAADLATQVKRGLGTIVHDVFGWTDSKNVLAWLNAHPSKWNAFVANRVAKVQNIIESSHWQYVSTDQNPADSASRGMRASALLTHDLWWKGPPWLQLNPECWPACPQNFSTEQELKPAKVLVHIAATASFIEEMMSRYSSFTKLKRITAYLRRPFINRRRRIEKMTVFSGPLCSIELQWSEQFWIRASQRINYHEEISCCANAKPIALRSSIARLNVFLDDKHILRVGGRLRNSSLPNASKFPIILSSKSPIALIIIKDLHEFLMHAGPSQMQASLQRRFWVVGARNLVRKVYRSCLTCLRLSTRQQPQVMADLPCIRVIQARAFYNTGVDMAGPFNLKFSPGRGAKSVKGYVAVFICMATGAMHLELASDLSTQSFIRALKRFVSRRGSCRKIVSDNGTNFVGAERELRSVFQQAMADEGFQHLLANDYIEWQFNPPSAPHMGGYWETAVKRTKFYLKRAISDHLLTYEEFYTVLTEIEACVNSRPLCPLSNDSSGYDALTPGHFLGSFEPPKSIPEPETLPFKGSLGERWQFLSQIRNFFWRRWHIDYLTTLQRRAKWLRPQQNLEVGDLAILKDDRTPPAKWQVGRILKCCPGDDGIVRVVEIKTPDSTFTRPVVKVIPLLKDTV